MKIRLFYRKTFIKECLDYWDAEAEARFMFFSSHQYAWGGELMPPGYMIVYENSSLEAKKAI